MPADDRTRKPELRQAAIGSIITLVGAATSALLGFTFSVVLARGLGVEGAGIVLQAIGCFTIALGVARLGLDTTAVWLLPRLRSQEPHLVRPALTGLLVPALVGSTAMLLLWLVVYAALDAADLGDGRVLDSIVLAAIFLPFAAVMMVALAATRAFGGVVPFNLIGNIVVPGLRPGLLIIVLIAGGGPVVATLAWGSVWFVGAVLALAVLYKQAKVRMTAAGAASSRMPDRVLRRRIRGFALPRILASALEQSITWLDVVLVGALIGAGAAGVYGTVSRFVLAGALVGTALRIVVAPRFSALLGEGRVEEVETLYTSTARWILLLGAPVYLVLAMFSPTVLGWLGDGFEDGVTAMVLLSLGSIIVLAAGNVQSLLLMSGRSGAIARNKAVVLVVNVGGNLVLVPLVGIAGAAVVWVASMALDTALAVWQVRRHVGVTVAARAVGGTVVAVVLLVGVPTGVVALVLGQGTAQLLLAVTVSSVLLLAYCVLRRQQLDLDVLRSAGRPREVADGRSSRR